MFSPLRAVFFDVDGVLVDSLPAHLRICNDKAVEYGLTLRIPDIDEFRGWVSRGVKISPMKYFFLAVGFPAECVDRAVADYERDFAQKYRPQRFAGVDAMLRGLHQAGLKLGLVTSNTRENVLPALGPTIAYFEPSACFFFKHDASIVRPKSWLLAQGAHSLGFASPECIYVGDQPGDAEAARESGLRFLGVTYGWGIIRGDARYDAVDTVAGVADRLLGRSSAPGPECAARC